MRGWDAYGFVRLMVRYIVGRDTENNSPRSEILYSPDWCIRFSSRCCIGDGFRTTSVSPVRTEASAWSRPGRSRFVPLMPWSM